MAQRPEKVKHYAEENEIPFNILIDEPRTVLKQYGVWHRFGLDAWNIARPALFLIDHSGTIRYTFIASRQDEFPGRDVIVREIKKIVEGQSA